MSCDTTLIRLMQDLIMSSVLNQTYSCYVKADVIKLTYNWIIDNFANGLPAKSKQFSSGGSSIWSLSASIVRGCGNDPKDYLSINLHHEMGYKIIWAKYSISIINANNEKVHQKCFTSQFDQRFASSQNEQTMNQMLFQSRRRENVPQHIHMIHNQIWAVGGNAINVFGSGGQNVSLNPYQTRGIYHYLSKDVINDPLNGLLVDNKLTICCEISEFSVADPLEDVPEDPLSSDLNLMLDSKKFADFVLEVDGTEIPVHKAILSARSPYFSMMFQHSMKESEENRVNIPDFGAEVIKEMLLFIYTGRAPNMNKVAKELLAAADKFLMPQLKVLCEESLMSSLCVESAPEILLLAHLHEANKLKTNAMEFIIKNRKTIRNTENWKLLTQQQDLFEELFDALSDFADKK